MSVLVLMVVAFIGSSALADSSLQVEVEQGTLEGQLVDLVTGNGQFYSFKGIPYAAPPVGSLRFKAPQAPVAWDGVLNATQHGPVCPQYDVITEEYLPGSEDCLYLNVYTQELNLTEPRPVMVFIHGGGFLFGSGNDSYYGADFLVQHEVVVVTLNYRMDALGFLCLDTEDVPGNAGLKDQALALKWVKNNIGNFSGDPDNITIFGQSAGGTSVTHHVLSPLSKGLFNRAIAMSGVSYGEGTLDYAPRDRAFLLGRYLGIYTNDTTELLEQLQAIPVQNLTFVQAAVFKTESNILKSYFFTPVTEKDFGIDDQFITEDVETILLNGTVNDVDIMIGHTDLEYVTGIGALLSLLDDYDKQPETLVPTELLQYSTRAKELEVSDRLREYYFGTEKISNETMKELVSFVNAAIFFYDIRRFARQFPVLDGRSIYFYQFSCYSERNVFSSRGPAYGLVGAGHIDDIMYVFNANSFGLAADTSSRSYKMVNQTCTLFTNFAKYGNPTPDSSLGVTWEPYSKDDENFLNINETLTPLTSLNDDMIDFWQSIYDYALNDTAPYSSLQVEVEQGTLEGQLVDLVTGNGQFYSFKGIPYAAPPVGSLRFKIRRGIAKVQVDQKSSTDLTSSYRK